MNKFPTLPAFATMRGKFFAAAAFAMFAAGVTCSAHAQVPPQITQTSLSSNTVNNERLLRLYFVPPPVPLPPGTTPFRFRWRTKSPLGVWLPDANGKAVGSSSTFPTICSGSVGNSNCVYVQGDAVFPAEFQAQIAAVNADGQSEWSPLTDGEVTVTTVPVATAPGAPVHFSAMPTPVEGELTLTWGAGGGTTTGYRVRWRIAGGTPENAWRGWVSDTGGVVTVGDSDDGIGVGAVLTYDFHGEFGVAYDVGVAGVNQSSLGAWASDTATTRIIGVDATLDMLTLSAGTLAPPNFDGEVENYSASVAFADASVMVTPRSKDAKAHSVTVNGNAVTRGDAATVALSVGANTVTIVATAEDESTTKTYTLTITRAEAATDATLSALTISAGSFEPGFAPAVETYRVEIAHAIASVTFTPAVTDSKAEGVTINASALQNGAREIALSHGENAVRIVVTAEDSSVTKTYSVNAVRFISLDVDAAAANGVRANDGIIIARFILGVRGNTLLAGQSDRTDTAALQTQLQAALDANLLDADGDSDSDFEDAIAFAKYFLGFRETALHATHAAAIEARIQKLLAQ